MAGYRIYVTVFTLPDPLFMLANGVLDGFL